MHSIIRSSRVLSSFALLGALALGGCAADTSDLADSPEKGEVATAAEALSTSTVAKQLVGTWHDSKGTYPLFELKADSSYTYNTGIVCITTPCPSGDTGSWFLLRSGSYYDLALVSTAGNVRWYAVGFDAQPAVARLTGEFGTQGAFVKQKPYCVEWQAADVNGVPQDAFYAENVKTYQEGKDRLASIGTFVNEAIREGTCASQSKICMTVYIPVCGQVFNGPESTYSNTCNMKVAIRGAAGDSGSAKGRWNEGACVEAPTGPFCGGIAGIACPGLGTCMDDPTDTCDPSHGADCGGVCECSALAKCAAGYVFDSTPEVCSCVLYGTR
jgi:hypothetical protein